jgi:hypothetical protein
MHGSDRDSDLNGLRASLWLEKQTFNESEMALFSECMQRCEKKGLTAPALLERRFIANKQEERVHFLT